MGPERRVVSRRVGLLGGRRRAVVVELGQPGRRGFGRCSVEVLLSRVVIVRVVCCGRVLLSFVVWLRCGEKLVVVMRMMVVPSVVVTAVVVAV